MAACMSGAMLVIGRSASPEVNPGPTFATIPPPH